MQITWRRLTLSFLVGFTSASVDQSAQADDASPPSRPRTMRAAAPSQGSVRPVQYSMRSRYPFAESQGAYRYPNSYPYYRYAPRQYPFGNGPYGPYGSNYGGFSGNGYDSGVYGSPFAGPYGDIFGDIPIADATDDADAPEPPADIRRPPPGAPDTVAPPPATIPRSAHYSNDDVVDETGPPINRGRPHSYFNSQAFGEPVPYSGGSPYNPSYGGGQLYRVYPYYNLNDMWFGNHLIQGYGYYPFQNYSYGYGPPSGAGFYGPNYYGPEYMPQYYNYTMRNFGPYYPGLGGINGGAGMYQGW